MAAKTVKAGKHIAISPPEFKTGEFLITGTAPYCQNKFSEKAKSAIQEKQERGSTAKSKKREPRDFAADFEGATHRSTEGWFGIPATAFRNAMIDACRMAGYQMTKAKMSVFIEPDGFDPTDLTPMLRFFSKEEEREMKIHTVRNATGVVDLRARPMWPIGWELIVRCRWDEDQFNMNDIANLLMRAGEQVGVGEGRPFSKKSCGMGWGTFKLVGK